MVIYGKDFIVHIETPPIYHEKENQYNYIEDGRACRGTAARSQLSLSSLDQMLGGNANTAPPPQMMQSSSALSYTKSRGQNAYQLRGETAFLDRPSSNLHGESQREWSKRLQKQKVQ
ncbi:unnamed protein product [Eretmochelys imbricata]